VLGTTRKLRKRRKDRRSTQQTADSLPFKTKKADMPGRALTHALNDNACADACPSIAC